jgi:zinc transport system substrate-binding protein
VLLGLAGASCGRTTGSTGGALRVVAAFYPIAFAAEQIGGPAVAVHDLTPAGAEPHDLELRPSDLARLRDAGVVLYLGGGFQPAVEDALKTRSDTKGLVDVLSGLPLHPGGGPENLTFDPHVWLDPVLMRTIADRIATALAAARPSERTEFGRRVVDLDRRLTALDGEYRRALVGCKRHDVVTSHAAFGYLAAEYGLTQIAITGLAPEAEPSPKRLAEVAKLARDRGATTIFFETLVSPRVAQAVARTVGAETDVLDPIEGLTDAERKAGVDYFSIMRKNLAAIVRALGCGP